MDRLMLPEPFKPKAIGVIEVKVSVIAERLTEIATEQKRAVTITGLLEAETVFRLAYEGVAHFEETERLDYAFTRVMEYYTNNYETPKTS